jgi:hypothetical protein
MQKYFMTKLRVQKIIGEKVNNARKPHGLVIIDNLKLLV